MNWFSIIKSGKPPHRARMAKEVRSFFRPIVYAEVEKKFANSKEVEPQELNNLIDKIVTVKRYKQGNPDSTIRQVKVYTVNTMDNYYQMGSYKLKQMGFKYIYKKKKYIRRE